MINRTRMLWIVCMDLQYGLNRDVWDEWDLQDRDIFNRGECEIQSLRREVITFNEAHHNSYPNNPIHPTHPGSDINRLSQTTLSLSMVYPFKYNFLLPVDY